MVKNLQLRFISAYYFFLVCHVILWLPGLHPWLPTLRFPPSSQRGPVNTPRPSSAPVVLFLSQPSWLLTASRTSIPTLASPAHLLPTHWVSCESPNLQFSPASEPLQFTLPGMLFSQTSMRRTFSLPSSLCFSVRSFLAIVLSLQPRPSLTLLPALHFSLFRLSFVFLYKT